MSSKVREDRSNCPTAPARDLLRVTVRSLGFTVPVQTGGLDMIEFAQGFIGNPSSEWYQFLGVAALTLSIGLGWNWWYRQGH